MCSAALLFSSFEMQAQRSSSSRSSDGRTTESRGSSGSTRSGSTSNSSSRSAADNGRSGSSSVSKTRSVNTQQPEATPAPSATMEKRGSVQTGTANKKLKAERVSPSENYRKLPTRGAFVSKSKAVKKSQLIRHNNHDYYYKNGIFYHHTNDRYVVSRPPVGVRVSVIPTPRVIWLRNVRYYYYYGTFYTMTPAKEYEVVMPPVGAIVESIPEGYEKLEIDGNTYYIVDGVQYKAVVYDGEIWYEVLKIID